MMRQASVLFSRHQAPLALAAANQFFRRLVTELPTSPSQADKEKLANQLYYSNSAQSGKFYGYSGFGRAEAVNGFSNNINWEAYSTPLYVVSGTTTRVKLWLVEESGAEETLRTSGAEPYPALREAYAEVPIPNASLLPSVNGKQQIWAEGTDRQAAIWCPDTDELWEIHRLGKFATTTGEGPVAGEWKFGYGSYAHPYSTSKGVAPLGEMSASGLSGIAGNISLQDIVEVLRGDAIRHALGISVYVRANEHLAPAKTNDSGMKAIPEYMEDGITANPAYAASEPYPDAIPEGLWCRFPPASRASEYGMSGALEAAMYEAMREYGVVVRDGGGACSFYIEDPRTLGSPYSYAKVNPFSGAISPHGGKTAEKLAAYLEDVPSSWTDASLPRLEEEFTGASSVFSKMPWRELEQLEPRSS